MILSTVVEFDGLQIDTTQFVNDIRGADMHWYFIQATQAMGCSLYVPAASSFLNGFEATLRVTLHQLGVLELDSSPSPYRCLSNTLIKSAEDVGMDVKILALEGDDEFFSRLYSQKPSRVDVELVRIRNNLCHGNVYEYLNRDLGDDNVFFTPECLRDLCFRLLNLSILWAEHIGEFRRERLGL